MNEYQRLASRTINEELSDEQKMYHALHGMVGEVGELHSLFQKIYQGHKFDELHAMKETGDLLWFIAEFCTAMGWNLDDVQKINIEKLENRYPDKFDVEHSLHRAEGDI